MPEHQLPAPAPAPAAASPQAIRSYERFNTHQRVQHAILAFSFTFLVITGWPMRFPELAVSKIGCAIVGGVEVVGIIHRVLGVILILTAVYHLGYLAVMFMRGRRSVAMLPSITDGKEAWGDVLYWLGLRRARPRFGRYSWIEKVEYFAVLWGTAVMILSGLVIWVPTWATRYFPGWVVSASVMVHGYEALLAGLAIFLWHFYWVHLHPDVYPMSTVWLTGRLTEEEMKHHHPRELERIQTKPAPESEEKSA